MQNTYLYIRYSDDKQAQGSSYERQLSRAKEYCSTLIEDREHVYFDAGKSAFKGEHMAAGGELKRFYDNVKDGLVPHGSTLLVEDLDRLSRAGMWKASEKLRELVENGIAVVTLRDGKRYAGVLNVSDGITALIKQDLANEESEKKSDRVAKSYIDRYAKARTGVKVKVLLPSWIEWVSDSEYKLKEKEAEVVRTIFSMAAEGYSYAVIAKTLNQQGIEPFRSRGKGKLWITASLFAIIKGRAAIGDYAPRDGGGLIEGYFPAVVDRTTYEAAQGARAERKKDKVTRISTFNFNIWSKVGICGWCQRPLHCLPKGRNAKRYLVCSGKTGGTCDAPNIKSERAELAFREVLLHAVSADYFIGDKRHEEMELRQLAGQIAEIAEKRQRVLDMFIDEPLDEFVLTLKAYKAKLEVLKAQKAELEQKAAREVSVARSRALLMAKIDLIETSSRMDANALLKRLGISVEILRSDQQINYTVRQGGKKILFIYDRDGKIESISYSQETAQKMFDLGDTAELEYFVELSELE
ncbi:recombinase family protein [Rugamonas rivuli]|nr:recombinase family protein [Rugamonas rivuli]